MRLLLTIFFLLASSSTYARLCLDQESIKLQWTGYKTATKAPVSGSFTNVKFEGKTQATTLNEIIKDATMTIDLTGPISGDPARDTNLTKYFFNLVGKQATATITNINRGYAWANLKLGSKTIEVALRPELVGEQLSLKGTIDLFDFALTQALQSLNKACRALHEGKTWNDVAIEVTAKITKCD